MSKDKKKPYYWCIVPMCSNTTTKTPNKEFIFVPRDEKKRVLWLNTCRRNPKPLPKSGNVSICEDHFDVRLCVPEMST